MHVWGLGAVYILQYIVSRHVYLAYTGAANMTWYDDDNYGGGGATSR